VTKHYFAERNSPSDEVLHIHEIFVNSGDKVKSGEVLFSAEGAKALFDIEVPEEGVVTLYVEAGAVVPIGAKLFSISNTDTGLLDQVDVPVSSRAFDKSSQSETAHFSEPALELVHRYKLDLDLFKDLQFVTTEDVRAKLESKAKKVEQGRLFSEFKAVALVGGGMGAEVLLERLKISSQSDKVRGYFDVNEKKQLVDVKYLGEPFRDSIYQSFVNGKFDAMLITVTSNMRFRREMLNLAAEFDIPLASFIDENSFVCKSAVIGAGSIILDSARVGYKAQLGKNVFLSGFVNIDHHCEVGENSTFGPGVFFSGNVKIGIDNVFGSNIAVEPGIVIGNNCKVASGSVITRNVPSATVVKTKSTSLFRS